jgi:hypothetical protein
MTLSHFPPGPPFTNGAAVTVPPSGRPPCHAPQQPGPEQQEDSLALPPVLMLGRLSSGVALVLPHVGQAGFRPLSFSLLEARTSNFSPQSVHANS